MEICTSHAVLQSSKELVTPWWVTPTVPCMDVTRWPYTPCTKIWGWIICWLHLLLRKWNPMKCVEKYRVQFLCYSDAHISVMYIHCNCDSSHFQLLNLHPHFCVAWFYFIIMLLFYHMNCCNQIYILIFPTCQQGYLIKYTLIMLFFFFACIKPYLIPLSIGSDATRFKP